MSLLVKAIYKTRRPLSVIAILFLLSICSEREARAYVDPGSGAMMWQLFMGGVIAISYTVRKVLSRIRRSDSKSTRGEQAE